MRRSLPLGRLIERADLNRAGRRRYPVLSMTMHGGLVEQSTKFKKRVASSDTAPYKVVNRNQLVVGFPIDEGVLSFQRCFDEAIVSPAYDVWNLRSGIEVEPLYLERFLRSPRTLRIFKAKLRGTTARRRTLPEDIFLSIDVPLPSLREQRRIATVLDKADELRTSRRACLQHLNSFTRALFSEMFGDPVSNSMKWATTTIDQICRRITVGIVVQPASHYRDTGVPALRSLNIRENKIATDNFVYFSASDNEHKLSKTRVWEDDVLLVRSGQPGTSAVVPRALSGVNAIDILIATPDKTKVHPTYLSLYLNSEGGKRMVLGAQRGQIQKHLNVAALKAAPIQLPPLSLQREFARRVQAVEALEQSYLTSAQACDVLFSSLQHRAFQGIL